MNPLTQIKNTQKATQREIAAGFSESASWHAKFKHSAYIFAGGLEYTLTEGDLLAVFSQYGEIVDVNLVRDKETSKSRGFAFLAYEDQRSTVLAVDNLSGARVAGRIIRVDHVDNYKVKRAEVEGRPVSDSDDDEGMDAGAMADAEAVARMEGATVERIDTGRAAGPSDGAAGSDAPWAGGSSVFALLQQEVPKPVRAAGAALTGALAAPAADGKKEKKAKKEKKGKKEKKEKRKHEEGREKKSKKKWKAEGGPREAADISAPNGSTPEDGGEPEVRRHAEGRSAAGPDSGGMQEAGGSRHRERDQDRRPRLEESRGNVRYRDRESERGGGGADRGYGDGRRDGRR